ncbi:MAG: tetratricopeptide repeat protein [Terracidiphilus sp.]
MTDAKRKPMRQWTQKQAVMLSLACLAAGIGGGWLIHGSRQSGSAAAVNTANANAANSAPAPAAQANDPAQLKTMADSQAAPLIEQLKSQPNNAQLLTSVGNLYYDAKQYPTAVDYYGRALKVTPADASVRTDMGTGYWYMGDADRAIEEFNLALSYAPNNPNTLFNRGLVKWKGKKDAAGALADWQQLLAANPDYQAKDQVEQMIAEVKAQVKQ